MHEWKDIVFSLLDTMWKSSGAARESIMNGRGKSHGQQRMQVAHHGTSNRKRRVPIMQIISAALLFCGIVMMTLFISSGQSSIKTNNVPFNAFPTKSDFRLAKNESATYDGQFVYVNTTYRYRYSSKLLASRFPDRAISPWLPFVVFGVCANSKKPIRRHAIRRSWGQYSPVFFIVAGDWDDISVEFERQGDLLWIDAPEDYRDGLTPKSLGFIHFAATELDRRHHFPLDYIFKTDDDVYANTTEISLELSLKDMPQYYGLVKDKTAPIRNKTTGETGKWYLSRDAYPDDYFPPYAPGVGYALSREFAGCAADHIDTLIRMPWEDVATGILASQCQASLASADDYWSHFLPFDSPDSALTKFPYETFKDGTQLVKILHKVAPWYFVPLHKRESLAGAKEYAMQKRKETQERREQRMEKP
jgi:hypothetical protein